MKEKGKSDVFSIQATSRVFIFGVVVFASGYVFVSVSSLTPLADVNDYEVDDRLGEA